MRVWLMLMFMLVFGVPSVQSEQPQVEIVKMPAQLNTRYFDPKNPPADRPPLMGPEAAVSVGDFRSNASVGGQVMQIDATHAKARINRIKVALQLNMTIWLPNNPQQRTVEHEEGHRQISEYYYRNAEVIARRIAEPHFGKTIDLSGADLRHVLGAAIDKIAEEITVEYKRQMPVETTQARYDDITEYGRKEIPVPDAVAQALKETYPEPEKPAAALVDRPEYLAWKNFRPGAKVVYAARYWNLAASNKFSRPISCGASTLRASGCGSAKLPLIGMGGPCLPMNGKKPSPLSTIPVSARR